MKAVLSENNIPFVYEDISASMVSLKDFLVIRDTSDAFREIRGTGKVGIPLLVVDGEAHVTESAEAAEAVLKSLQLIG